MSIEERRERRKKTSSKVIEYEEQRRKKKKRKGTNKLANRFVLFLIIIFFTYTVYGFAISVFRKNVDISLVESGTLEKIINANGNILRNEKVIYSNYSGNIQYFFDEGSRVGKGNYICKITNNEIISELEEKINKIDDEILEIQNKRMEVSYYKPELEQLDKEIDASIKKYYKLNNTNYQYDIYDLRNEIENKISLKNTLIINESSDATNNQRIERAGFQNELSEYEKIIKTDVAGVVSYYIDGFEEVYSPNNFINSIANNQSGNNKITASAKKKEIKKGEPVFKIIDNYEWYIACKIDNKNIGNWQLGQNKKVRFSNVDNSIINAEISDIVNNAENSIVLLKFSEQGDNYLQFRGINFDIIESKTEGLKIPNSAIIQKNVFYLPKECVRTDKDKPYIIKKVNDTELIQDVKVLCETASGVYVDQQDETIHISDRIVAENNDLFKIEKYEHLKGAYVVVGNIAKFRQLEVVASNDKFSIIKALDGFSIKLYDNVITNPQNVKENEFVK